MSTRGSTPSRRARRRARTSSRSGAASADGDEADGSSERLGAAARARTRWSSGGGDGSSTRAGRSSTDGLSQLRALERLDVGRGSNGGETVIADLEEDGEAARRSSSRASELRFPRARRGRSFRPARERRAVPARRPARATSTSEGRLVLVRRLVREGFLRIRRPDAPPAVIRARARRGSAAPQVRCTGSSELLGDLDLVDRRVRGPEADAPARRRRGVRDADELEVVEPRRPSARGRALGRLHRERVARAPAVALELDRAGDVRRRAARAPRPARPARSRGPAGADDVAGEAVAADVGRLPDPGGSVSCRERVVERRPCARSSGRACRGCRRAGAGGRRAPEAVAARAPAKSSPSRSSWRSTSSSEEALRARSGRAEEDAPAVVCPALRLRTKRSRDGRERVRAARGDAP